MILIGSRALYLRCSQALMRKPKDFDFVATMEEAQTWVETNATKIGMTKTYPEKGGKKLIAEGSTNVEFDIVESGNSNDMLRQIVEDDPESIHTPFGMVPTLDMLFTIKASHKYLKNSPHFWKTVADYHILKRIGATIRPEYQAFFKLREKETYNYAHPKLNQGKDSFFADDNINYVWDHDTIHESVARFEKPAYTYYIKDGAEVQTSKQKFFDCPREIQLAGIVEEAAVLAIERSLVPHPGVWTPEYAWRFALAKVCSSITSGWFREFGYENLPEIIKMFPVGYWEKFEQDVASGKVKPFTGKKY
jgi:hypothetical protein